MWQRKIGIEEEPTSRDLVVEYECSRGGLETRLGEAIKVKKSNIDGALCHRLNDT